MSQTPKKLLRPGEAAKRYGVSIMLLYRWACEGHLTSYQTLGGHHRYDPEEIEALMRQQHERRKKTGQTDETGGQQDTDDLSSDAFW